MNPFTLITILTAVGLLVAFLFSRGQRREAPEDEDDPSKPLPVAKTVTKEST